MATTQDGRNNVMYPFKTPALTLEQPFGDFVVAALPVRLLLDVAYSERLRAVRQADGSYQLEGSQRELLKRRQKEIGEYIDTGAAAFPNAIIIAANYREDDGLIEDDEEKRWIFERNSDSRSGTLRIPDGAKMAAIIDGQHRLFGFKYSELRERLDMELVCTIYFDLPKPYQASLFATINANQRPVSKSQTYESFGYNLEEETRSQWVPEKLSVFITRKLNAENDSPLYNRIAVPAENDFSPTLASARRSGDWAISMATSVEGIVRLISRNPRRDANAMSGSVHYEGKTRAVLKGDFDPNLTPLRELYLLENDELIFTGVKNYFEAVQELLWRSADEDSYIHRTVGVQALFEISVRIFKEAAAKRDVGQDMFVQLLQKASGANFSDDFFQASGKGRSRIRHYLELLLEWRDISSIERDQDTYKRLLRETGNRRR
jgi:DNA phosphorothioation-associated DGQHR protein 1